ncbi:MAG TPA: hypothetical protein VGQ83_42125 [Polyangia bacterium]|jgi:hypothetical protein
MTRVVLALILLLALLGLAACAARRAVQVDEVTTRLNAADEAALAGRDGGTGN